MGNLTIRELASEPQVGLSRSVSHRYLNQIIRRPYGSPRHWRKQFEGDCNTLLQLKKCLFTYSWQSPSKLTLNTITQGKFPLLCTWNSSMPQSLDFTRSLCFDWLISGHCLDLLEVVVVQDLCPLYTYFNEKIGWLWRSSSTSAMVGKNAILSLLRYRCVRDRAVLLSPMTHLTHDSYWSFKTWLSWAVKLRMFAMQERKRAWLGVMRPNCLSETGVLWLLLQVWIVDVKTDRKPTGLPNRVNNKWTPRENNLRWLFCSRNEVKSYQLVVPKYQIMIHRRNSCQLCFSSLTLTHTQRHGTYNLAVGCCPAINA